MNSTLCPHDPHVFTQLHGHHFCGLHISTGSFLWHFLAIPPAIPGWCLKYVGTILFWMVRYVDVSQRFTRGKSTIRICVKSSFWLIHQY
jgi:hypothetical protein